MTADASSILTLKQVAIVGTGLLGASMGLALKAAGFKGRIVGVGRQQSTIDKAKSLGCVTDVTTDLAGVVAGSDLIVLATPLNVFPSLLRVIGPRQQDGLVITDVGSTKTWVCNEARRMLTKPARFVGSHPMAGAELHGPEAAKVDLFAGRPCIVTPVADTDKAAVALVESLWTALKMRIVKLSPPQHDRHVARISHLPHAVAAMVVNLAKDHGGLDIASSGFRDTTRVASGDPVVWTDIFSTNRDAVSEAMDQLIESMQAFRSALSSGDDAALTRVLTEARDTRNGWLSIHAPRRASDRAAAGELSTRSTE